MTESDDSPLDPTDAELRAVLAALRCDGLRVAVAESLTGGLLTAALTRPAGASDVVRGGLVTYATDLKTRLADVSAELLAERGAVDADVAIGLARGARLRLSADVGLGVTGVAGPDEQDGQPVGTVYVAISGAAGESVSCRDLPGDRDAVRRRAVRAAVGLLAREWQAVVAR